MVVSPSTGNGDRELSKNPCLLSPFNHEAPFFPMLCERKQPLNSTGLKAELHTGPEERDESARQGRAAQAVVGADQRGAAAGPLRADGDAMSRPGLRRRAGAGGRAGVAPRRGG